MLPVNPNKTVIIIAGPTAVGKTQAAIELATHLSTEIISADSRQCFKELHIGVARPSEAELEKIPHHFIASHSVHDEVNAVVFEQYALAKLELLFEQHDTVIMVGGTGLYIRAFCEGLDEIPAIDPAIRETITSEYALKGLTWLQEKVRDADPAFYASGEIQNPQRLIRALEVNMGTGQSVLKFRKNRKSDRPFAIRKYGLQLPREELIRNINHRVDTMMEKGLLAEVKNLVALRHLNALQTVGYTELFDYIDNKVSLEQAIEQIMINTRQYAKRQMTWFKKDPDITWLEPGKIMEIVG